MFQAWQIRQWFSKPLKSANAKSFCFQPWGKKWKKYFWSKSDWHHVIIHVALHNNTDACRSYFWEEEEGDFYTPEQLLWCSLPQKLIVQLFFGFLPFGKWISWEIRVASTPQNSLVAWKKSDNSDITTLKTYLRNIDAKSRTHQNSLKNFTI